MIFTGNDKTITIVGMHCQYKTPVGVKELKKYEQKKNPEKSQERANLLFLYNAATFWMHKVT
jgi:hypothetical protein